MVSSVSQSTLDHLARRLDELAAEFPTQPEAVDPVTLADDIATLSHHLQHAVERAWERFAVPDTVHAPERVVLVRLARATAGMAHALDTLAEALTYATTGFQREAVPDLSHTHLRNDPQVLRMLAAEKYVAARARLRNTAADLRTAPPPASPPTPRATLPTAVAQTPQRTRP
ncbi:hypothetical protein [Streptomyces sp. GQFP]|uniref:hypothetical protein n=1 Tax=Streptomyces sp. GQFP TaxID=2907545 RepID=UPI001F31621E|nr:hypothetical protein [Streptomyces sp. GQFP]UIX34387.1 hypothetical protein LUX31_32720 [Streptomyces sp. GQFP]